MKMLLFVLLGTVYLSECDDVESKKDTKTIDLACDQKLVSAGIDDHDTPNFTTRSMRPGETPETYMLRSRQVHIQLIESSCK
jgi:hypothetical protein